METMTIKIQTVHPEFSQKGKPGPETPRISAMVEVLAGDSAEVKAINLALAKAYVPVLKSTYDAWLEKNSQALSVQTEAEKTFTEAFGKPITEYAKIVEGLEAEAEAGDKDTRKRLYKALGVMEDIFNRYTSAVNSKTDYVTEYTFGLKDLPTEAKAAGRPKSEAAQSAPAESTDTPENNENPE